MKDKIEEAINKMIEVKKDNSCKGRRVVAIEPIDRGAVPVGRKGTIAYIEIFPSGRQYPVIKWDGDEDLSQGSPGRWAIEGTYKLIEDKETNQAKIASALDEFENELKSLSSQYSEIADVVVFGREIQATQGKIQVDFVLNQGYELTHSDALEHPVTRRYGRGGSPITGKGYEVAYWLKKDLFLLPIGLVQNKYAAEMRQSTYQNAASTLLSTFIKYCVKETGRVEDSIDEVVSKLRNPETNKIHSPNYYPNKETGTTRVSVQNAILNR
jgi:hypothetical protein